jgi:hypothetical protein
MNDFPFGKRDTYLMGAANQMALPVENKSCFVKALALTHRPSLANNGQVLWALLDEVTY